MIVKRVLEVQFAIVVGLAISFATSGAMAAEGRREVGAHAHGQGILNIAIDGNTLQIQMIAPGADIVGFEHAPNTDEQKQMLAAAKTALEKIETVATLPSSAGCTLVSAAVEMPNPGGAKTETADKAETQVGEEVTHSEFQATYELNCASPRMLGRFTLSYFDSFKGAKELDVTIATNKGQAAFEATRANPEIRLDGLV